MSKVKNSLGTNTRQMLDELDALMEKMLSLPVNQLPDAEAATSSVAAPAQPASIQTPPVPVNQRTRAVPSAQVLVGQLSVLHSQAPVAPPVSQRRDTRSAQQTSAATFDNDIPPPLAQLAMPVAAVHASLPRQLVFSFRPLLWINQGFDLFTQRLGLAGGWLRSSRGRMMLGLLGLTLLGVAAGWLLKDWMGWTWELDPLE